MLQAIGLVVFGVIMVLVAVTLMALLGGTIVYFCWPVVMVPVFHLPPLTWLQAVCLAWICGVLIKSSQTNNNKK
jgi:hypothetical protein